MIRVTSCECFSTISKKHQHQDQPKFGGTFSFIFTREKLMQFLYILHTENSGSAFEVAEFCQFFFSFWGRVVEFLCYASGEDFMGLWFKKI